MGQKRNDKRSNRQKLSGFTIVELLIVVVVIAILAAITIVSYNGITAQAKESALKSELTTAAKKLNIEKINNGSFPGSYTASGLTYSGGGNSFCVSGVANGKDFRVKEAGSVEEGDCPLPVATTMQSFTSAHCSALGVYTGSNPAAIQSLTDSRDGITRTYEVAKLADGKCWMLANLKLGSTTGSITLTPADSNVASNFTLPQLITNGNTNQGTPQAVGPVPGDNGSGATNYGYLYNYQAATAGNSAQSSICPAGWRLPVGGQTGASELGMLDAKMSNPNATQPSSGNRPHQNWTSSGTFKGVYSGRWVGNNTFDYRGSYGYIWAQPGLVAGVPNNAYVLAMSNSGVYPGTTTNQRAHGSAIRCLLN